MSKRAWLLFVSFSPLLADQVVLTNGDRVTGQVVKKDGGVLSVKTELMGDVTIKWENVAALTTDLPVTVTGADGQEMRGRLSVSGSDLQIASDGGTRTLPLKTVAAVRDAVEQARHERYLRPPLTALWAGYVDVGLATAQGNARTLVLSTSLQATRATRNDSTNLHLNQIYSRGLVGGTVVDTAKAVRGGWTYNRNFTSKMFVNVFNDYEFDAFQNLDLRLVAGGGLGANVWKRERGLFSVVAGGAYDHDRFSIALAPKSPSEPPRFNRTSGEAYWGDDLSLKLDSRSSLKQSFRMFNNLTNRGEYRVNFDLGTETKIARWLSWQLTASDRYLTNPAPGRKTNDLLLSSGIRITFAR